MHKNLDYNHFKYVDYELGFQSKKGSIKIIYPKQNNGLRTNAFCINRQK